MMSQERDLKQIALPSVDEIYASFKQKYSKYGPDFELYIKAQQVYELNALARATDTILLKHNYMTWDLQADEVIGIRGDSLELSRKASGTTARRICFLGVRFMAETAFTLNKDKTVLIPSLEAGCSLASSIEPENLLWLKELYPGSPVVMYVNTEARIKALTDVCCASGNATKVLLWTLEHMDPYHTKKIIFGPDMFLAMNKAAELGAEIYFPSTGVRIPARDPNVDFQIIGWPGQCEVHNKFTKEDVDNLRTEFPDIYIMAHPECPPEVIEGVDLAGGTGDMLKKLRDPDIQKRLVAILSECGLLEAAALEHPNILQLCSIQKRCPYMATNTWETVMDSLRKNQYIVTVPEETRAKAEIPVRRMIDIR